MAKAVILAGGQGERFWPLTHKYFPKYRIKFDGKRSLLQGVYQRLLGIYGRQNIYVITTLAHARMVREELPSLARSRILMEPFRNNTCAAIYLSCALLEKSFGPGETVSFFPADHLIQDETSFKRTMQNAVSLARKKDMLVTIGIQPAFPATGYGYIQKGNPLPGVSGAFGVKRFVEKPDKAKAALYLKSGQFFWNAGMFTWRLGVFMRAMERYCPEFPRNFDRRRLKASYKKLPDISIDFALMEKARDIAVIDARMDWCDMGNWDMLYEKSLWDKDGNYADGLFYRKQTRDSLVINQTGIPVITLGVSGLIVVQTPRGTLICPKGRAEEAALLSKKVVG